MGRLKQCLRPSWFFLLAYGGLLVSCAPTVKVEAPDRPIVINLNVNIEHKIKVEIDKQLDDIMDKEKGIF